MNFWSKIDEASSVEFVQTDTNDVMAERAVLIALWLKPLSKVVQGK